MILTSSTQTRDVLIDRRSIGCLSGGEMNLIPEQTCKLKQQLRLNIWDKLQLGTLQIFTNLHNFKKTYPIITEFVSHFQHPGPAPIRVSLGCEQCMVPACIMYLWVTLGLIVLCLGIKVIILSKTLCPRYIIMLLQMSNASK